MIERCVNSKPEIIARALRKPLKNIKRISKVFQSTPVTDACTKKISNEELVTQYDSDSKMIANWFIQHHVSNPIKE